MAETKGVGDNLVIAADTDYGQPNNSSDFVPADSLSDLGNIGMTSNHHWEYSFAAGGQFQLVKNPLMPTQMMFFYERSLEQLEVNDGVQNSMDPATRPELYKLATNTHRFGLELGQFIHIGGSNATTASSDDDGATATASPDDDGATATASPDDDATATSTDEAPAAPAKTKPGVSLYVAARPYVGIQQTCDSGGDFYECKKTGEIMTTNMSGYDEDFNFNHGDADSVQTPSTVFGTQFMVGIDPVAPRNPQSGVLLYATYGVDFTHNPWSNAQGNNSGTHVIHDRDNDLVLPATFTPDGPQQYLGVGVRVQGNPFQLGKKGSKPAEEAKEEKKPRDFD